MNKFNFMFLKNKIPFVFNKTALLSLICLPVIHFLLTKLIISISFDNGSTVLWPSSGIYMAGMFIFDFSFLPAIFLSELIVNTWLYYNYDHGRIIAFVISLTDTLDPLIIYLLVNKFIPNRNFLEKTQDIFKFIGIVLGECFITSNLAAGFLYITKATSWDAYAIIWWGWWISISLAILVITPTLLIWIKPFKHQQKLPPSWKIELFLIIVIVGIISKFSFGFGYPLEYTFLPILIWSAFRFRLQETTLITLLINSIAVWGVVRGIGSFHRSSTIESMVLLQSFIGVFALTSLVLSAAVRENWWAEFRLKQANETLEDRVEERTIELQNTLHELKLSQSQVIQSEKMSSLGQLVAGVAHEINNPVNFIHGNITHLKQYTEDLLKLIDIYQKIHGSDHPEIEDLEEEIELEFLLTDMPKIINSMEIGTERIRDIVLSLRNFSRIDEAEFKRVNIHDGIESTLLILQYRLKANSEQPEIQIIRDYGNLPEVECYAGQLNQVFMNILVNGIDAVGESNINRTFEEIKTNPNQIRIRTKVIDKQWIEIRISDNAQGMSEDIKNHIFDPFFTTKDIGKGTGMGMAISYQIITKKHHGKLECSSNIGKGTEFIIQIPSKQ
ncbi:MASE1 domain-containing protein [Anabaena cylindrica UHCC 0172]|uniref:MASE1 domain-containing protein n=1 Tax=Anabaena cylindrica TaxID=1165 RepID=UPI002B21E744|nr:MASE1 domain-containing protein [Anabaena cylindrica]MEA5550023.1 MASE1 domain-containing protein [Anabaena cylindrica UHCC 0172]